MKVIETSRLERLNDTATKDVVPLVKDRRLPRSEGSLRPVKLDAEGY